MKRALLVETLTISVEPLRVGGIVTHFVSPKSKTDSGSAHDGSRMATLVLLAEIGCKASDGIQDELFFLGLTQERHHEN